MLPRLEVVLPSVLHPSANGHSSVWVPLPGGSTIQDVLTHLGQEYPLLGRRLCDEAGMLRRHVNIYVDGDESRRLEGLSTPVWPGREVLIIASVAGG